MSKYFYVPGKDYVDASDYETVLYKLRLAQEKIQDLVTVNMQLQVERNKFKAKSERQEEEIKQLETELEVKENLLKIKSVLCENAANLGICREV